MKEFIIRIILTLICFVLVSSAHADASPNLRFLVLSDIHFDPYLSCPEKGVCPLIRSLEQRPVADWPGLLSRSDRSEVDFRQDTNFQLLTTTLANAKEVASKQAFAGIFILGDLLGHQYKLRYKKYAGHFSPESYRTFVKKTLTFITEQLALAFPDTPIYNVVGNNDSYQNNYISDPHGAFFKEIGSLWSTSMKGDANNFKTQFQQAGYYAVNISPTLRLIALNSNLFSSRVKSNKLAQDASQQLAWLHRELVAVKNNQQKAIILMHIPPSIDVYLTPRIKLFTFLPLWKKNYIVTFNAYMSEFSHEIVGLLAGHLHSDWYHILSFQQGAIDFIGVPSISPIFGGNPGFKVIDYSSQTEKFMNYTSYYYPLNRPQPGWFKYEFNRIFRMSFLCEPLSFPKRFTLRRSETA